MGASNGNVVVWDDALEALQFQAWHNFSDADMGVFNEWYRTVRGGTPVTDAYFRVETIVVDDLQGSACPPEYRNLRVMGAKYGFNCVIAVPLVHGGTPQGALALCWKERTTLARPEHDFLASAAGQLAVTIQISRDAIRLRSAQEAVEDQRRALARQHALLERIIQTSPWVVAYFNRDFVFEWVNPAAIRLSPVPGETFVGKSLHHVFPFVEWPNPRFLAALREGRTVHVPSSPLRTGAPGNEKTTYWDMALSPVLGNDGAATGVLLLCVDVSERVEAEKRQQSRIEHLEELDRLKRDFLNMASHELRTPLSSILGYAEFLEDEIEGPLTGGQETFVGQIQDSANRLRAIVEDILDFARMEAGTFQLSERDCNLDFVVEGSVESLLPQAREAGVSLGCHLPARALPITCDPQRIGQVVLNLVGNAIKFTARGGKIAVTVRRQGKEAVVRVTDTGIGIPGDHMTRLFEKFYQVDPSNTRTHGGAGLGLAICRSLVEAHGGRIWAASQPGQGSTFEFAIPINRG